MSDETKATIGVIPEPEGVYWRGSRLWVRYPGYQNGRRKQQREPAMRPDGTPAQTPKEAARFRKSRLEEVAMHRRGVQTFQGPRAERVLFTQLLDAYEQHAKTHALKSLPQIESRVKRLTAAFPGYRALAITHDVLMRYVQQRQSDGAAPATINRELEVIGRAFALARTAATLAFTPKIPSLPERNARQGFFEATDLRAVVAALPDDDLRDFTLFGYRTAWRKGEIASLLWADMDHAAGVIRLRPEHSKTGRGRVVALDGELKALIARRWQARTVTTNGTSRVVEYVFHRAGEPIGEFRKAWASACIKAGLFHVITDADGTERKIPARLFHDLRRTGVRNMVRAGVPERVAMEISGHRTRAIFDRYNIVSEEDVREAVARTGDYVAQLPSQAKVVSLPKAMEGRGR